MMRDNQAPKTIRLSEYKTPAYWVHETKLHFDLHQSYTRVVSQLSLSLNTALAQDWADLTLDGADLELESIKVSDQQLSTDDYQIEAERLSIRASVLNTWAKIDGDDCFSLEVVTRIDPANNTSLEGLYVSNGMYCTQCEAQGFRKITYYPDRPDVMSRFVTTIEADKKQFPCLLSNGNKIDAGESENGRHWATWEDPFKKPAYLFALVAGDLASKRDTFRTASGKEVVLEVFVEPHDLDKVDYGIGALKRAMTWDEQVYGREYDLDIYMIVAVSHFNMGAMENKGLNIFNTACVLAKPETTTDARFERVESVIAHEYFHNWSGNRVTCRDWFQLSLKEGFTVFRDQCFSADIGSAAIKRVEDVQLLRTHQFAEDAGPMAHPVRPDEYIEINNFYTVTVYEKGAEVVRMLHTLLGPEGFRKGSDLYFDRHDGQAVTCEDFVKAMSDANGGVNLESFMPWYSQAGTPVLKVKGYFDAQSSTYTLTLQQSIAATTGQEDKVAVLIPVKMALLDSSGQPVDLVLEGQALGTETVLRFEQAEKSFVFEGLNSEPVPSLLRGFSAPVQLSIDRSEQTLAFLAQHDADPFNRWEAMSCLFCKVLLEAVETMSSGGTVQFPAIVFDSFQSVLESDFPDKGEQAQLLALPSEAYLSEQLPVIAVDEIHGAIKALRLALAERFEQQFESLYQGLCTNEPYAPEASQMSRRKLKNLALHYLCASSKTRGWELAALQFQSADNMTDQFTALQLLVFEQAPGYDRALIDFYEQWQQESLVVDMWLSVRAQAPRTDALQQVEQLLNHEAFDWKSPNRIRSVVGGFANANPTQFHDVSGQGYQFLLKVITRLNQSNPQIAARLVTPLSRWRKYDEQRQQHMLAALNALKASSELSSDVFEMVSKSVAP